MLNTFIDSSNHNGDVNENGEEDDTLEVKYEVDGNVINGGNLDFVPDPRGLGWCLFESMKKYKDSTAQVDNVF